MSASVVLIIAAVVGLLAALTGVFPKTDLSPAYVLTSPRLRWSLAACSMALACIGFYMWDRELMQEGWAQCSDCPRDMKALQARLSQLEEDLTLTQSNLNKSADLVYEDSSLSLWRVASLIGRQAKIGCEEDLAAYLRPDRSALGGSDICSQLRLLMHPVTITAAKGIDKDRLVEALVAAGIPTYISSGNLQNANSDQLAILIPDGVGKDVVCTARNAFEQLFKEKNPSSEKPAIRYAISGSRVAEINAGRVVISSQTVQLGVKLSDFATNVREITAGEWRDACSKYLQQDFDDLLEEKSSKATKAVVQAQGQEGLAK